MRWQEKSSKVRQAGSCAKGQEPREGGSTKERCRKTGDGRNLAARVDPPELQFQLQNSHKGKHRWGGGGTAWEHLLLLLLLFF